MPSRKKRRFKHGAENDPVMRSTRALPVGLLLLRFRVILILFQLGLGRLYGGNSTLGHFYLGTPGDGVEHKRAKIIVTPIAVEVAPGKSKATPPIRSFVGPSHVLDLTPIHRGTDMGIPRVTPLTTIHGLFGWVSGENRSDPFHLLCKACQRRDNLGGR